MFIIHVEKIGLLVSSLVKLWGRVLICVPVPGRDCEVSLESPTSKLAEKKNWLQRWP